MNKRVCHLTSVHSAFDTRIFKKECCSLVKSGYDVFLIAPNVKSQVREGVHIVGVNTQRKSRYYRMFSFTRIIYRKALEIDACIYHFHDPELLPVGVKLKSKGKKVIFDSHEDVPQQIMDKKWIPLLFRGLYANLYAYFEKRQVRKLDAIVTVSPNIVERFKKYNQNTILITNFPKKDDIQTSERKPGKSICFAGNISPVYMHQNILSSLGKLEGITYLLAGKGEEAYLQALQKDKNWNRVEFAGQISSQEVWQLYVRSFAGVAIHNYTRSVDGRNGVLGVVKIFEFMSAGIPVICSDLLLWKKIVEEERCGICVNPHSVEEITKAIKYLSEHPLEAQIMGKNGQNAVLNKYNWELQEVQLLKLYQTL